MTGLTAGVGLKAEHYDDALRCRAPGMWFEVHAENYMVAGGPRRAWLEAVRREHPLSLHGVSLSLAGSEPVDPVALAAFARLVRDLEPEEDEKIRGGGRETGDQKKLDDDQNSKRP